MILTLEQASLGYGDTPVLSDITLALSRGERVVLLGRSGAGKTTLLHALFKALESQGERVALVPQDMGLVPQLSVLHNVLMGRLDDFGTGRNLLHLLHVPQALRREISDILDLLGIRELLRRPVGQLSGGQKQRVALARALFRGGDVVIADEPVSALDEARSSEVMALLESRFSTAVIALHDVALARSFATRIVGLKSGQIVYDHAPSSFDARLCDHVYG